jgi:ADP-ribose pyrophosphatase YjhB (NUDIX family)
MRDSRADSTQLALRFWCHCGAWRRRFPPRAAMNFCSNCGAPVALKVPAGDTLPRYVCDTCKTIHYSNPKMVIGCIPEWEDRVLLCKRAIEPRLGLWTLPAGFMENGETTAEAAMRETLEEANARVELGEMFTVLSVPYVNQVHIFYRSRLLDLDFGPGSESLEVALFGETDVPWQEMAFRTVTTTLQHYYEDRRQGAFRLHAGDVLPRR